MSARPTMDLTGVTVRNMMLAVLVLVSIGAGCGREQTADLSWIEYPVARRGDDADAYYGVSVPDPYRWMEDEGSEETRTWLAAQSQIAERFFDELEARDEVRAYLEENWIEGVIAVPARKGNRVFYWEPAEGQNHPVL